MHESPIQDVTIWLSGAYSVKPSRILNSLDLGSSLLWVGGEIAEDCKWSLADRAQVFLLLMFAKFLFGMYDLVLERKKDLTAWTVLTTTFITECRIDISQPDLC